MADNYLEKREEEIRQRAAAAGKVVRNNPSLDTLLKRSRSYRGYDTSRKVTEEELKILIGAARLAPSGMNRQTLRYKLVTEKDAGKVLPYIKLGAALKELNLPLPGTEPRAFIVACSTVEESRVVGIDLGFAAQNILLKAVSMGLGGIFILNFKADDLSRSLSLPLKPMAVIAIGKPAERIFLTSAREGESLDYYRKDGVHFVPKLEVEDLLL